MATLFQKWPYRLESRNNIYNVQNWAFFVHFFIDYTFKVFFMILLKSLNKFGHSIFINYDNNSSPIVAVKVTTDLSLYHACKHQHVIVATLRTL